MWDTNLMRELYNVQLDYFFSLSGIHILNKQNRVKDNVQSYWILIFLNELLKFIEVFNFGFNNHC